MGKAVCSMGSQSSKTKPADELKRDDHIFPDTVVQRFSFYAVLVCLALSVATFLWVSTNAGKWNANAASRVQITTSQPFQQTTPTITSGRARPPECFGPWQ